MDTMNDEETPLLHHTIGNTESLWRRGRIGLVLCILCIELCERLAFYSVTANLILYCTSVLHLHTHTATTLALVFSGTVYMLAVTGGLVADAYAGKFKTIVGSTLLSIIGMCSLSVSAYDEFYSDERNHRSTSKTRRAFFYMGLTFVGAGAGGIKASVGAFGADQVKDIGPKVVQSFFIWFYWFINIGAFVAFVAISNIQHISFALGYLLPAIVMIIGLVVFILMRRKYIRSRPRGILIFDFGIVIYKAKLVNFKGLRQSQGGEFPDELVDGVISVLRMLPVFSPFILYWAVYSQMQTTFFIQGERMKAEITSTQTIPIAFLTVFNTVMVLTLIPVVDRVLYPALEKCGRRPSPLQRMGFGLILSTLSVVAAGVLEIYRKKDLLSSGGMVQTFNGDEFNASTVSIFAQVPQYALIGASEVFTCISGLEFAYSEAPEFMQGLVIGVFFMIQGLGNYLSTAILAIVLHLTGHNSPESWFPGDINEGKTENLFFLFAALIAVNTVVFVFVAKCYKPTQRMLIMKNSSHVIGHDS